MPRHIVLVGLPGSGKSTVGKLVAEALGTKVIDIDGLLVREMRRNYDGYVAALGSRWAELRRATEG